MPRHTLNHVSLVIETDLIVVFVLFYNNVGRDNVAAIHWQEQIMFVVVKSVVMSVARLVARC